MKKRILLSLMSFFVMTAMWASMTEAYQIYASAAAAGKTNGKAELQLNLKCKNLIGMWSCTVVLPEGITFVEGSAAVVEGNYPAGAEVALTATPGENNTVVFNCVVPAGVTVSATDGAVAKFEVAIAGTVAPGVYPIQVKNATMFEADLETSHNWALNEDLQWTIEEGAAGVEGDATGDGKVDLSDYQYILNLMATETYDPAADVTGDGQIDLSDYQYILNIMSTQE
jgi:hypothetical protein